MSTDATIGIEQPDKSILAVYCKWDGYLDHTGRLLLAHFTDRAQVEALVRYGPAATVCEYIRRTRDRAFRCSLNCPPFEGKVGRPGKRPLQFVHRAHLEEKGDEYVYLFGLDGKWWWARYKGTLQVLAAGQCDKPGN